MNLSYPYFTFGADPEVMLRDALDGSIVSAIDVLQRGKDDKIDLQNGRSFYYDNVLAETNIIPADSRDGIVDSFRATFAGIANHLGAKFDFISQASHTFSDAQCSHEDARVFGCSPEYCAYTITECKPPPCTSNFRSAGGHIHVGGDFIQEGMARLDTIKLMDLIVGLPLAIIDQDDTSAARKAIYGNAGRHRPTTYGVEYRTPGNYWVGSPDLVAFTHDLTAFALALLSNGKHKEVLAKVDAQAVIEAVNTNNKSAAKELISQIGLPDNLLKGISERENRKYGSLYEEWNLR